MQSIVDVLSKSLSIYCWYQVDLGMTPHNKHVVLERMKANYFFLAGSVLYLPVALWDLVAEQKGKDNPEGNWNYMAILIAATVSYLCNGLLETKTAYTSKDATRKHVFNGLLFTIAATFELFYALAKNATVLLSISAHFYVANSLLTLYLRRKDSMNMNNVPARMIRAGDVLFLLGASADMTNTYLEMANKLENPASLWLFSSLAWLADAILYLVADQMCLSEEHHAEPIMKDSELRQKKLSSIV